MTGLHTVSALLALAAGAIVLVLRKGTGVHRAAGSVYTTAVVAMVGSSFGIYQLRDGPSVFHGVSVVMLIVVAAGIAQPMLGRRGRTGWMHRHLILMQISYLVLVLTGVVQFFDQLPLPSDALNAIAFIQIPAIAGFVAILRSARTRQTEPRTTDR